LNESYSQITPFKGTEDKNYKGDEWSLTKKGKTREFAITTFIGFELI
jgi:hypothetical protein